jgi:hypothetical protein
MAMSANPESFETRNILFQNGRSAEILSLRQAMDAADIQKALNFEISQAAIIVAGNTKPFTPRLKNRLTDLLSRGVAQAAADCGAIIIDDGSNSGISEIVGQGVADRGRRTRLVGVLPTGTTITPDVPVANEKNLDVNHTHFILNEQERPGWQAEAMSRLAEVVSCNKDWIMTVLVGGDSDGIAMDMALETVRRNWYLLVIEGSGSLADEIIRLKKQAQSMEKRSGKAWKRIKPLLPNRLTELQETNPRLYEIIADGRIMIVGKSFDGVQLRNLIKGIFTHPPKENLLWTAWQRFAEYDKNSVRHRAQWHRLKNLPLVLGVLSTLIVLIYSIPPSIAPVTEGVRSQLWVDWYSSFMNSLASLRTNGTLDLIFRFTIIVMPITISIILGVETRLKLGSKYILLRGAAEAVKRGIYSFRALGDRRINPIELHLPYDEKTLNEHLAKISKFLLESDVNEAAFSPYEGSIPPNMFGAEAYDDGFSFLKPDEYLRIRVGDQLKFYTQRTNQYEKRIRRLQYWMLVFGGVGTFLAAIGAQYWLPFTAAIVSATTAYLEYQQLEHILTKYNLTKSSLENARSKWLSLKDEERESYIPRLVQDVEAILESENQGWVQYVNQAQEGKETAKGTVPETVDEAEGASTPAG